MRYRDLRGVLSSTVAVMAVAVSTPAIAQVKSFDIPAQSAVTGIPALAKQADIQLLVSSDAIEGKTIRALKGRMTVDEAIRRLVSDADLQIVNSDGKTYTLAPKMRERTALQAPTYQAAQNAPQYDEIIVTAQKKEERITDVPIAMSAFSAEALDDYKIEGGSELLRAVPNMNFSKSNFSTYNISIRGVGTKAVSASTDPAVAVSFNNTPLIRNRLFESEFFDVARIEVLRGPQGTLYGRNATGGVVNIIPSLPEYEFSGSVKGEVGNFKTRRLSGMLNMPLNETLAVRVAGALTKRDGYDFNTFTQQRVNDRDLWSTRASIGWEPSERFKVSAIWQRFQENDNRARTGKQLCARDPGPENINGVPVPDGTESSTSMNLRGRLSQGCLPVSVYDPRSYSAPNAAGYGAIVAGTSGYVFMGYAPNTSALQPAFIDKDPFRNVVQSRNLREVSTSIDPVFKAKNDVVQLNFEIEISDGLSFYSQSAYSKDRYFSMQDYNRFVSDPVFVDTDGFVNGIPGSEPIIIPINPPIIIPGNPYPIAIDQKFAAPGGVFCDPQLGCSNRMLSADLSRSDNNQWSQEVRLSSDFEGRFNFNLGVNYLKFKSQDDYFVFNNLYTFIAQNRNNKITVRSQGVPFTYFDCPVDSTQNDCVYVDPNPISRLNGNGHNYFRSKNHVVTESSSVFSEFYTDLSNNLKLTVGFRVTQDKKTAILYPSQLLLGGGVSGTSGGTVSGGYYANPEIIQKWTRPTGRIVFDWKPYLNFTDDTLIYGSISHGYKGGGANPARPGIRDGALNFFDIASTFKPEYVNALEFGMKNTLWNGAVGLNVTAFYYDYKAYQVSQIVDRIALNENFDSKSWGLEMESYWNISNSLRVDANVGFLKTKLGQNQFSIDVMNRTQGDPDWVVVRPFIQVPSNCIAPKVYVEKILTSNSDAASKSNALYALCPQASNLVSFDPRNSSLGLINRFGFTYDPTAPYDPSKVGSIVPYDPANPSSWIGQVSGAPNQSAGFFDNVGGNEMPNSPRWTANFGVQYGFDVSNYRISLRGDLYMQSSSFARVYNTNYDKLKSWRNFNLSVSMSSTDQKFSMQLYVKNLFNSSSITDIFTNSDDSLLSTNVFTVDPRIIGLNASVNF